MTEHGTICNCQGCFCQRCCHPVESVTHATVCLGMTIEEALGEKPMGEAKDRGTLAERVHIAQERDERRQAVRVSQVRELKVQHACLLALVREQGRVRISRRDLESIEAGSRIEVLQDDLGVTLTFVAGDRAG